MAKYHTVSPNIWNRKFREVGQKSPEAQVVYLYLLTCRHRGSEGIFSLNIDYISIDTGLKPDVVDEALSILINAGFVSHDAGSEVVLDRHALRYYKPVGLPQTTGALNRLEQVPDSPLKEEFLEIASIDAPEFAELIVDAYPELAKSARLDHFGGDPPDTPRVRYRWGSDTASREEHQTLRGETEKSQSRGLVSDSDFGSDSRDSQGSENIAARGKTEDLLPGEGGF